MTIRVHLTSAQHCTVHLQPSRLARLFGVQERDFEAWFAGEWITHDNKPVSLRVADAIEAESRRVRDLLRRRHR